MAITGTAALVNGNVMDYADVDANFAQWRSWLNGGMVVGDFVAAGMEREAIARPRISGSLDGGGIICPTQEAYRLHERVHEPLAYGPAEWSIRRQPFLIKNESLKKGDFLHTDVAKTIFVPSGTTWISVHVQSEYAVTNEHYADTVPGPEYPDGAGVGNRIGYFIIGLVRKSTGVVTTYDESIHHIYPVPRDTTVGVTTTWFGQHLELECGFTTGVTNEVFDIVLGYKKGATTTVKQIDLGVSNMKVELFV